MTEKDKLGYTVAEAASAVGMSVDFIRKEIRIGQLPAYKIGSKNIIPAEDLRDWFHRQGS